MHLFIVLVICVLIIQLIVIYEPYLDIVTDSNKITLLLWYNKTIDKETKRVYIKIIEFNE